MKKILLFILSVIFSILVLPAFITVLSGQFNGKSNELDNLSDLEEYIILVVAAEMPVSFAEEALKAQAVAARTYAVNHLQNNPGESVRTASQAYASVNSLKAQWGSNFDAFYAKIKACVKATEGEIMVYRGEPILAVFHSMSAGITENSADVWSEQLPYLTSVESRYDESTPSFISERSVAAEEFISLLGGSWGDVFNITKRTEGGYVLEATFGGNTFTGVQLRSIFGLRSANFTLRQENRDIIFTVKGYGHGVGMSQNGANGMALDGADYKAILLHYYNDVSFEMINNYSFRGSKN